MIIFENSNIAQYFYALANRDSNVINKISFPNVCSTLISSGLLTNLVAYMHFDTSLGHHLKGFG